MYIIEYHPAVIFIDIPKLGQSEKIRIKKAIEQKLKFYPEKFGIFLRQNLVGYLKLRVRNYRIIFRIVNSKKIVKVFLIEHRSVAYKLVSKRIDKFFIYERSSNRKIN